MKFESSERKTHTREHWRSNLGTIHLPTKPIIIKHLRRNGPPHGEGWARRANESAIIFTRMPKGSPAVLHWVYRDLLGQGAPFARNQREARSAWKIPEGFGASSGSRR